MKLILKRKPTHRKHHRVLSTLFSCLSLILFCCQAHASLLNIDPILLTLTQQEPVTTLEIKNLSPDKTVIQADVLRWAQKDNTMLTLPTQDVFISPPIFQLESGQTQLLRIAWINHHPLTSQLTYRVILREVSMLHTNRSFPNDDQLKINLMVSIPVYIQPINQHQLFRWRVKWITPQKVNLVFENVGNMTCHITQIQLLTNNNKVIAATKTFAYILPQHHYSWTFHRQKNKIDKIEAIVNGELNTQRAATID